MILIVVCGATATGKSGLAMQLAKCMETVIISADSRQVYRDFNVGTAKPSLAEQQAIKHYMIDVCDPYEMLTVAQYQRQTQEIISSKASLSQPLLLVGGTGLYLKSIIRGLRIPPVAPQTELRAQLASLSQVELYQLLFQVDPVAFEKIHPRDGVRTLRALEVFYVTGVPISEQQGEDPPSYPILQIGLDCDLEALRLRIAQRTEKMLAMGLVAEVESLLQKYPQDLHLFRTLGYQEIKSYLEGNITLAEAKELTIIHTGQFAKRQKTWFRKIQDIHWLDANSPHLLEQTLELISRCSIK